MKCDEVKTLLWDLYEGDLTPQVYRDVTAHISSCEECAREARMCEGLNRTLKMQPLMQAPRAATAAVMDAVRPAARWRRLIAVARRQWWPITATAAALVFVALGLCGVIPGFEASAAEQSRIDRALATAGGHVKALADSAWHTLDLSALQPYLSGWMWLGVIALGVIVVLVATEKYICDRRLAVKIRGRLQRH